MYYIYQKNKLNVERILAFMWISLGGINTLEVFNILNLNPYIALLSGILGLILLVYHILNKSEQYKQKKLQNKEIEINIKRDQLDLTEKRRKNKESIKKSKRW